MPLLSDSEWNAKFTSGYGKPKDTFAEKFNQAGDAQLNTSIDFGVKQNPDAHAQTQKAAKQLGLPIEVVERNPDVNTLASKNDIYKKLQDTEHLKKAFKDPNFAAIAHDDIDGFSKFENTVKALGVGGAQATLGMSESIWRTPDAVGRVVDAIYENVGINRLSASLKEAGVPDWLAGTAVPKALGAISDKTTKVADAVSRSTEILGEEFEPFRRISEKGHVADMAFTSALKGDVGPLADVVTDPEMWAGFIGQAAPSLYTAYKSGGSIPFIAWMEGMEVANDAADFEKRTGQKIDPTLFTLAMAQVMTINTLAEKLSLDKVFGRAGKGKLSSLLTGALTEGGTEGLQQFNTNVAEYLTFDPNKKLSEGIVGSVMGGVGVGGPSGMLSAMGKASGPNSEFAQRLTKSQKAFNDQEKMNAAVEAVKEVKTKGRKPEAVKKFVDDILGAESEVLIPAEDADTFFQSHPEIMQSLPPEVSESIQESIVTGGDVAITKSDYLTYLSDFHEELSDSLRNDMDGMTAKEANEWIEQGNEQFEAEAEKILAEQEMESEFRTSADNVQQAIKDQIVQTGRFTEDVAEKYSQLHKAFAVTVAERTGQTPEQVYEKFGLRVQGVPILNREGAIEKLMQADPTRPPTVDEVDAFMEKLREAHRASEQRNKERYERVMAGLPYDQSEIEAFYQAAYHGTPHKFDKFSLDAMGTGEGVQAYGWGLYFASDKRVAEWYRETLVEDIFKVADGSSFDAHGDLTNLNVRVTMRKTKDIDAAINRAKDIIKSIPGSQGAEYAENDLKTLEGIKSRGGITQETGQVYQVDIPGDDELLDWDKSVGEQSDKVKKALVPIIAQIKKSFPEYANNPDVTGQGIYEMYRQHRGGDSETASKGFHDAGILGLRYLDGTSRGTDGDKHNYVIWDEDAVTIEAINDERQQALYQEARGQIQFDDGGALITLLENADLSTMLHESAHFFFEAYKNLADNPEIAKDMQTLLDFVEVDNMDTWNSMTLEERRDGHEKVARAFEAYLFEGKSPNIEMQSLFSRFRDWLLNVYQNLAKLNVNLTPEVRQVFDRMLATKEQIREKEVARAYDPLFESAEDAGMTPKQWREYQNMNERQRVVSESELQTRSLKDMKWLSNAKNKAIKALQSEAKAKRKAIRAEVSDDVSRETVYQAINFLKTGEANGVKAEVHKIDQDEFVANYPNVKLPRGLTQKEGMPADLVGEMFGYSSGDEMVQSILNSEPRKARVERLTDEKMLQTYGDLTDPVSIERAAEEAIHNEAHTRFLHTELSNLAKRTGTRNVLSRAAKQYAEQSIDRKKVRDIRPYQYSSAEARAAKNAERALVKGDRQSAAEHKRSQVLNNHFFRAANNAQTEIEKMLRYFKKFSREGTRKNLDPDYRDQIDAQLEKYELRKLSLKEIERRKSLAEWVTAQEEQGFAPIIDDRLLSESKRQNYKDTTLEEMRGLRDSIKNIEHLARLKTKLLRSKAARELDEAATIIGDSVTNFSSGKNKVKVEANTWMDRAKKGKDEFFAMHRKFASLARQMDGFKDGPMWEYFIRPMNEAGDFEAVEKEKATMVLHELFTPIVEKGGLRKKQYIKEINSSLSKEGRLVIALNWGNESNRQRIMDGEGWDQAQVQAILDTLSKEDWNFVQSIWDYFETFRPAIAEKERRVSGVEPEWIDPSPVNTKHGEYKGGYYPVKFNPERSQRAEKNDEAEIARKMMLGAYTRDTTKRSFTKGRVEKVVGMPLRYDFGGIFEHIGEVVHDLAWHEWLIDTNRLLAKGQVNTSIREGYGPEVLKTIRTAVHDIASGDIAAQNAFEKSINHLRTGTSIAGMGWNLWTSLLQPLGLTQSMARIGPKWVAKGMAEWMGDAAKMENTVKKIYDKSDFMRLRGKTMQREINEIRNKVSDGGKLPAVTDTFFYLIAKAQMVADIPSWLGAYEKAVHEGNNEDRAVALANQAVLDAQGGGQIKDLAQIQRGSPLLKLWTNFYSFFNTTFNLTAESYGKTHFKNPAEVGRFAVDMMLIYTVPATISALMREALKGSCNGNEDCVLEEVARENLSYMMGIMVGVREMSSMVSGYFGYSGPAGTRFFSEMTKLGRQIEQGNFDSAQFWKALNAAGGILFHYPSGQIQRAVEGTMAIEEGKVEGPQAIVAPLVGPPR